MPFRFRRSIRISTPACELNIGRRGLSASVGVRGAHITTGHGSTRTTVGVPGSGVSLHHHDDDTAAPTASPGLWRGDEWLISSRSSGRSGGC